MQQGTAVVRRDASMELRAKAKKETAEGEKG
jgi:hypothetical protein